MTEIFRPDLSINQEALEVHLDMLMDRIDLLESRIGEINALFTGIRELIIREL